MNLKYQAIYQIVCEEMSMTKAAKKLNMSQPAISQVVKDIEGHFGMKMFERRGKALFLTEAGQKLLYYTNELMRVHDDMEIGMEDLRAGNPLKLAFAHGMPVDRLIKGIQACKSNLLNIEFQIEENTSKSVIEGITKGKLDIGFVDEEVKSTLIKAKALHEEDVVIINSSNEHIKEFKKIILYNNERALNTQLIQHLSSEETQYRVVAKLSGDREVIQAVENGMGMGIVLKKNYEELSSTTSLVEVEKELKVKFYLIYKSTANKELLTVIEALCQYFMIQETHFGNK